MEDDRKWKMAANGRWPQMEDGRKSKMAAKGTTLAPAAFKAVVSKQLPLIKLI
jgi:hypothetical protein